MTKTSRIMKPLSGLVFALAVGIMIFGLFTPGARWLVSFGFVISISAAFSSLGFWATQDLDKESPAGASPKSPYVVMPKSTTRAA